MLSFITPFQTKAFQCPSPLNTLEGNYSCSSILDTVRMWVPEGLIKGKKGKGKVIPVLN
jgi:hypothetical protein